MAVSHVEFLVEEPSMEAALRVFLPRVLESTTFGIRVYQGKEDLLKQLPNRLRGYAAWLPRDWRIVVLVDRDDDDCAALKHRIDETAAAAGMTCRTGTAGHDWQVASRLATEELEAWHFGDWDAVLAAYPKVSSSVPKQARYRNPDAITGGTWEAFERVLQKAGYFRTGLRKIEAARAVASKWNPARNRSHSFGVLRDALRELASAQ